ncbi:MAG: hypothetical protein HQL22_00180 [Candidatus Omnitrophica bacterium]|nr:hypothetical protein [Candidatus Omnitrophota bacterium]
MALRRFFKSDWFAAAVFLATFLLTNRYIYGWDDQHLEIPLLKHLIDPQLYSGDYYVESLKANFTSFLFPILARIINVDWVQGTYLVLYLFARYFLFFFLFRLWQAIAGSRWIAGVCTLSIFLLVRPEEFIYRTFSHQEFSYIFVFSGLLLFYRSRYLWAATLFGLGANIHALYCLFPMMYLGAYLLFFHRDRKWELLLKTSAAFFLTCSPFLAWTVIRAMTIRTGHPPNYYDGWIEMYHLSCPQNFIFGVKSLSEATVSLQQFFIDTRAYFFVMALFLVNWRFSDVFRKDHKVHAVALTTFVLILINFLFTYVWPSHFVLDLNLLRNEQYLLLFLGGYSLVLVCQEGARSLLYAIVFAAFAFFLSGKELPDVGYVFLFAFVLEFIKGKTASRGWLIGFLLLAGFFFYAGGILGYPHNRWPRLEMTLAVISVGTLGWFLAKTDNLKTLALNTIVAAALVSGFISFCYLHYNFVQISTKGGGFWQLQRNWEEMQVYVRDHTPKNAVILAPNDMEMGGFRIHSNRSVVVCYRDCGIIGFDYGATKEWQQRLADIDAFKVFIKEPIAKALMNGIFKYGADYVVFLNYAAPPDNGLLTKIYGNEVFSLYQVTRK